MKQYSTLDMQGNEIVNCPSLNGGGGDANLTEEIVSNVAVGGAPSGTKFDKDLEFTEFAKKILRTDVAPSITFSATGSGLKELGTTVNGSTLKLVIGNLPSITLLPLNTITFKKGSTVLETQNFVEGENTYTFSFNESITENVSFSGALTYQTSKKAEGSASIKFVAPSYYGVVDSQNPTEADIVALTKSVKDTKSLTWNGASLNDQRFCYAYPSSLGDLTSIKDANNFEYLGSYTKTVVPFSVGSSTVNYNVYVLEDPVTITGAKQAYA